MKSLNFKDICLLALIIIVSACSVNDYTGDTEEKVTLEGIMSTAISQAAYNQTAILGRSTAALMQHLESTDNTSTPILINYNMPAAYLEAYWKFGLYNGSLKNANDLLQKSQSENNVNSEAIARILLALEFGQATATFGDLPYTEALSAEQGLLMPKFDPQESIYNGIIDQLEKAIELIDENIVANFSPGDLLANGEMNRWKQLAYGLLARYTIQLTKRDPSNYLKVIPFIEMSFPSVDAQLEFKFSNTPDIPNPFYSFAIERPDFLVGSNSFITKLENNNDPRKSFYFNADNSFENLYWSQIDASIPILSYAELMFMKAETLLMTGADDNQISEALGQAIQASFDQINPNIASETYIENRGNLNGLDDTVEKLDRIITEAYTSYYGYGSIQAWNNYRRLNFPILAQIGSSNPLNPTGILPRRFIYPESPAEHNADNLEIAVNRQGGALLDKHVWAFDN